MTIIYTDETKKKFDLDYIRIDPLNSAELGFHLEEAIGEDRNPGVILFEVHVPNLDFSALFEEVDEPLMFDCKGEWIHTMEEIATIDTATFEDSSNERERDFLIQFDLISITQDQLQHWTDDNSNSHKDFARSYLANNVYFLAEEIRVEKRCILFFVPPGTGEKIQTTLLPYLPQLENATCCKLISTDDPLKIYITHGFGSEVDKSAYSFYLEDDSEEDESY